LVGLAKNPRYRSWVGERLDRIYEPDLAPIWDKSRKGLLPDRREMDLVSRVRSEIQGIDPRYVPQTIKYISRIRENRRAKS